MKIVAVSLILLVGSSLLGCTSSKITASETDISSGPASSAQTLSTPAAEATATAQDFLIVPGERVGPITKNTTYNELATLFEETALTDTVWAGPEGLFNLPATTVNLGEDRSFQVVWLDQARTQLYSVTGFGSDWQTPEGVYVGMPLSELEEILGPFQLSGFGWDYGGYAFLEGTRLAKYQGQLYVRLSPSQSADIRESDLLAVSGEGVFDSDHPSVQAIAPTVANLDVEFRQLE